MSEFNELYEHLKQCVDSDNDSYIGITEQGVEFNMFEWAFGLAVKAKAEHDKLQAEKAELIKFVKKVSELDIEYIEFEVGEAKDVDCLEYVSSEIVEDAVYLLNKLQ